jgi:hypothetical protein
MAARAEGIDIGDDGDVLADTHSRSLPAYCYCGHADTGSCAAHEPVVAYAYE